MNSDYTIEMKICFLLSLNLRFENENYRTKSLLLDIFFSENQELCRPLFLLEQNAFYISLHRGTD